MKPNASIISIMMHAMLFRTKVLRESGMRLPEHTFYVDILYAYVPLKYVKTIYYFDEILFLIS